MMSLRVLYLYISYSSLFLLQPFAGAGQCPCQFAPKEDDSFSRKAGATKTMCIVKASEEEDSSASSSWYRVVKELAEDRGYHLSADIHISIVPSYQEGINNHSAGIICDSYLQVISDNDLNESQMKAMRQRHYLSCPGTCLVVPHMEIPSSIVNSWLEIGKYKDWPSSKQNHVSNQLVSCSQTIDMMRNTIGLKQIAKMDTKQLMIEFIRMVFWRRITECKERKHWAPYVSIDNFQGSDTYSSRIWNESRYHLIKRKIYSLIVWIGSVNRYDLMKEQASVLLHHDFDSYFGYKQSQEYVVPFFSSEITFPCRPDSTICTKKNSRYIPKSDINRMPVGWACAQRRPLRTLSHILLLFDPEFILMADDDTYINYDRLVTTYRSDIYGIMQNIPIVLGEFQGKPRHLTSKGLFVGGSGYFLSKAVVNRLISNETIHYVPGDKYHYRTPELQRALSVAIEAFQKGSTTCPEDCVDYNPLKHPPTRAYPPADARDDSWKSQSGLLHNGFISISIPLVQLCTNMMANEHTCLHSDHSLGRCLVYGANIVPVGMVCTRKFEYTNDTNILHDSRNRDHNDSRSIPDENGNIISYVKVLDAHHTHSKHIQYSGMCFMSQTCDKDKITCHRYKAMHNINEGLVLPVKYYTHRSYFREDSSCEVMGIGKEATPLRWCD